MGNSAIESSVVGQTERSPGVGGEKGGVEVEMVISRALQELTRSGEIIVLIVLVEVETSSSSRGHHRGQASGASTIEVSISGDSSVLENVTSGEGSSGQGNGATNDTSVRDDGGLLVGLELRSEESASRTAGTVSEDSDGLEEEGNGTEATSGVVNASRGEEGLLSVVRGGTSASTRDGVVEGLGDGLLGGAVEVVGVRSEKAVQVGDRADGESSLRLLVIVSSEGGGSLVRTRKSAPLGDEHGEDQIRKADNTSSVVGNVGDQMGSLVGLSVSKESVEDVKGISGISRSEGGELENPSGRVDSIIVLHEKGIVGLGSKDDTQVVGVEVGGDLTSGDVELSQVVELGTHSGVDSSVVLDGDGLGNGGSSDGLSSTSVVAQERSRDAGNSVSEKLIVLLVDVHGGNQEHGVSRERIDRALAGGTSVATQDTVGGSGGGVTETSVGDGDGLSVGHGVGRGEVEVGISDGEHGEDSLRPATTESSVEADTLILVGRDEVASNSVNVLGNGLSVDGSDDLVNIRGGVDAKDGLPDVVSRGTERTSTEGVRHLTVLNSGLNVEGTQHEALVSRGSAVEGVGVEQGVHHVHQISLESIVRSVASRVQLLTELSQVSTKINLDVVGGTRVASHISERVEIGEGVHAVEGGQSLGLLDGDGGEALLQALDIIKKRATEGKRER